MNSARLCKVAAVGLALSMLANTPVDAEVPNAIDEIRKLYAEFQTFKNEDRFRRVGYGLCCKYYQWLEKVEALRGNGAEALSEFIRSFGILPGELILLGVEYHQGRGNESAAKMWEASIEAVLNPKPAEAPIDAENDGPDRVIGRWVVRVGRTFWENVTIQTVNGKPLYAGKFMDGGSQKIELVEIRAKASELRRSRGAEGSSWGPNEQVAISNDGKLKFYDELGYIRTAEPR